MSPIIRYHRFSRKQIHRLSREVQLRIVAAVRRYAETGRGDVLPVFGELDRLRVGNYRVFIGRVEGEVRVVGIFHRRVAYARHILRAVIERLKKFRE